MTVRRDPVRSSLHLKVQIWPLIIGGHPGIPPQDNIQAGYNFANYAPSNVDTLITQGVQATNASQRFVVYSKMLHILATDVPYVPLYVQDYAVGLAPQYTWPTFNAQYLLGAFELGVQQK